MYKFKVNKLTGKQELYNEQMNMHPSIICQSDFDKAFATEYARFEYFTLLSKLENGKSTKEDAERLLLLENEYCFSKQEDFTDYNGVNVAIKPLLKLTLFAHGKIMNGYSCDAESEKYSVKRALITLGLKDFYIKAKEYVQAIENGECTIENAVDSLKPHYNRACAIINHEAVEGICKKWQESTKEKCTRAFVIGLLSTYKLTRYNRIKTDSPLKSQESFEKYFAMWLVTNGKMVEKKQATKSYEMF